MKWGIFAVIGIVLLPCLASPSEPLKGPVPPEFVWGPSVRTVWNFDDAKDPLKPSLGNGTLLYFDPDDSGWGPKKTKFGKASSFKIPLMQDGDPDVMAFPKTTPREGYRLVHGGLPNGVFGKDGYTSNYTLIVDAYWPDSSRGKWRSLYQTNPDNSDDGDMYIDDKPASGIGIGGVYNGTMEKGSWHRLAITVQAAVGPGGVGQLQKFIDGRFVGAHGTNSSGSISRWATQKELLLLTTESGETAPGYLASILFIDRNLSMGTIEALGGPTVKGANLPGKQIGPEPEKLSRRVKIVAHRGNSCCAPENTLASINQAIELGAEWLELDIRWSKDRKIVLVHDKTLDRTTNGTGPVDDKTVEELKQLDAGSWFGPAYVGQRIPTLVEAFKAAKGRAKIVLDVKGYKMGAGIREAIEESGIDPKDVCAWQNKMDVALDDFRNNLPNSGIWWGGVPETLDKAGFEKLRKMGVVGFDLDVLTEPVTPEFVQAAHREGMFVSMYTIIDRRTMYKVVDLGIDAVETDFPGYLFSIMPDR